MGRSVCAPGKKAQWVICAAPNFGPCGSLGKWDFCHERQGTDVRMLGCRFSKKGDFDPANLLN